MTTKLFIQLIILLLITLIMAIFYLFFFKTDKGYFETNKIDLNNQINNKIIDLKYTADDKEGNVYIVNSEYGEISDLNENLLKLQNVNAIIKFKNSNDVIIKSKFADYNKLTLDTFFYENVRLTHDIHVVTSEKMFLNYSDKNINIQKNVVYKGNNNTLLADIVEIDLVTKFSRIYMLDELTKVKVNIKNGNN